MNVRNGTLIVAAVLLVGAALLGGLALGRSGGAGSADVASELRARLEAERADHERLAARVARLEADVASLREEPQAVAEADVAPYAPAQAEGDAASGPAQPGPGGEGDASDRGAGWFDARRLEGSGLPERDADEMKRHYEEIELRRLELQNQAQREGWPRGRLLAELGALDDQFQSVRQDYGDDAYDWYLYAAGRSNRVVVDGVLGGSAAAEAGLRPGDEIVSYDGDRIFKPGALIQGTLDGRLNESVDLVVQRGGETQHVTVPRGPLGIRLGKRTEAPAPLP
jgi:membrane-associated protease RseP (regulator of RpoE activity)